MLGLSTQSL